MGLRLDSPFLWGDTDFTICLTHPLSPDVMNETEWDRERRHREKKIPSCSSHHTHQTNISITSTPTPHFTSFACEPVTVCLAVTGNHLKGAGAHQMMLLSCIWMKKNNKEEKEQRKRKDVHASSLLPPAVASVTWAGRHCGGSDPPCSHTYPLTTSTLLYSGGVVCPLSCFKFQKKIVWFCLFLNLMVGGWLKCV